MEDCPHSFISNAIIGHQLYGSINENEQENDLKERLDEVIFCKMIIKFYKYLAGLGEIKKWNAECEIFAPKNAKDAKLENSKLDKNSRKILDII